MTWPRLLWAAVRDGLGERRYRLVITGELVPRDAPRPLETKEKAA
jgi:hypothetical protein